jgi:hypothetical protein
MEDPAPPPYRSPSMHQASQEPRNAQNGILNGIPYSFDGPPGPDEGVEISENGDFLPTLSTEEHMRKLDIIDQLEDLGIDHEGIDLPRLVVCGDQSSGKSSVLAAITRIPFPRQAETCTRFVTQIILRHDAANFSSEVSIEPGRERPTTEQARLKAFRGQIASDFSNLPEIIAAASKLIFNGIAQRNMFASDVLKVEIRGKEQQPLEILDLPGLINNDRTDGRDIRAVENIVKTHIQKRRSIVLVVIGADKDLRGHSILQTIQQIPGCRERAFGVITKPDVPRAQALDTYIDLAGNKRLGYEFEWGWHVLRNSTIEELNANESWQQRDEREYEFFTHSAWSQIMRPRPYDSPEQVVGIRALRKRVRELLYDLNQKELPQVQREILNKLEAHESRLQDLGGERDPAAMRQRLLDGCSRLSHAVTDYSRGTLINPDTSDKDILLRARIRDLSDEFTWVIHNFGHTYAPDHFSLVADLEMSSVNSKRTREAFGTTPRVGGYTLAVRPPKLLSQQQFYADGLEFLQTTRGDELDTYFDPQRITPLFQRQSDKWGEIARSFLREFDNKVDIFLEHALRVEFRTEVDAPGRIWQKFLNERLDARKKEARNELKKLLQDKARTIKTNSVEFRMKTDKLRIARTFKNFNNVVGSDKARRTQSANGQSSVMDPEVVSRDFGVGTSSQYEESEAARFQDDMLAFYVVSACFVSLVKDAMNANEWLRLQGRCSWITSSFKSLRGTCWIGCRNFSRMFIHFLRRMRKRF